MKNKITVLLVVFTLLFPVRSFALFGVGDIVIDPSNLAQAVQLVSANQDLIAKAGKALGISTEQLGMLTKMKEALGTAEKIGSISKGISPGEIVNIMKNVPGMQNFDLGSLGKVLNGSGVLDVFMGTKIEDWKKAVSDPMDYFGDRLISGAARTIGGGMGMDGNEIDFMARVGKMSAETREGNKFEIAKAGADMLLSRYLKNVENRKKADATLAAQAEGAAKIAQESTTTNEALAAAAAQNAAQTNILLKTAADASEASVTAIVKADENNQLVQKQLDAERLKNRLNNLNR